MTLSEEARKHQNTYIANWKRKNVKRIGLEVSPEKYKEIKQAADSSGESVNGYIKIAIDNRLFNDKNK